jgi:hypothetical protein
VQEPHLAVSGVQEPHLTVSGVQEPHLTVSRNIAGRDFGASCMWRCSTSALSARLAAPDADGGVEGADVSWGFCKKLT